MNLSGLCIARPIGTSLLAIGLLLAGCLAYAVLPKAPLPSIEIPTIVVFANRPGASPDTIATSITAPLERRLGEIAGVTELTSTSSSGNAIIVVQFDTVRDIDGAAYDVQAAISAAATDLPADLPARPFFRKVNPAQLPIMTIAVTSDTLPPTRLYDAADRIVAQRLRQVAGVARVQLTGAGQTAVRVQFDPAALAAIGLTSHDLLSTIMFANVNGPVGGFEGPDLSEGLSLNGQIASADAYRQLVLKADVGGAVTLGDVATTTDGSADPHVAAWLSGRPAILLSIVRLPGANVIDTVDRLRATLPELKPFLPAGLSLTLVNEASSIIRENVHDITVTILVTVVIVLLLVLLFMRRLAPTLAALAAIPVSFAGTLAAMWCENFSLDNFSLMALTISAGFVVDDTIVVIDSIMREAENGKPPRLAAADGAKRVAFTVVSINLSLAAVFIPTLFLSGILGRLFEEFSMTIVFAIGMSTVVSLTLTPMICGLLPSVPSYPAHSFTGFIDRACERVFATVDAAHAVMLGWTLRHHRMMLAVTLGAAGLTVALYALAPKGFLPVEDTGLIDGYTQASPDTAFAPMTQRQRAVIDLLRNDPAVASVASSIGGAGSLSPQLNRGSLTVVLTPRRERDASSEAVITRLRPVLARIPGMRTFLFSGQNLSAGGRQGGTNQLVLMDENTAELREWAERLMATLRSVSEIADVGSDDDQDGPQATIMIDRLAAARLGASAAAVDAAVSDAFAQRNVSFIYRDRSQDWVVLAGDASLRTSPSELSRAYVAGTGGKPIPMLAATHVVRSTAPLVVHHQGSLPAVTLSFNVAAHTPLSAATQAVQRAAEAIRMPPTVHVAFAGNDQVFTQSLSTMPILIMAAVGTMYIILGILYENFVQPLTILSTLPAAGLGALLMLMVTGTELSIIVVIGLLLLVGIIKKNAIMLIDFALDQERRLGLSPAAAIGAASVSRFRPITMTTLAAAAGAVPLALGGGAGAEFRYPLGITLIGGLMVSQLLTLYTTPVIYLALRRRRPG